MLLTANIPVEKADDLNIIQRLEKHVGSGNIIGAKALRHNYVQKTGQQNRDDCRKLLQGQKVVTMSDETTDCTSRCIFIVLLCVLTGNTLVECIVELDGSTYPLMYKISSKVSDLQDTLLLISRGNCCSLNQIVKIMPVLVRQVQEKTFLAGYLSFQKQVAATLQEERKVDVPEVLNGLKESHCDFAESAISALWIPPSNVDSQRALSSFGHILTDLRTNLKVENIEIMLSSY
ncbi:hypothetical protein PR048_010666 [Dryococelus australis]|uniref:Uncharacterized protein n=1 Tax=Dryococelus australis TaxID=614101 RepID=A0ABQ9I3C5_9NEOP|nr:hypothetical protein PR048_010666 [Dryococelus australis]